MPDVNLADSAITVLQLNQRLSDAIASTPSVRNVWVVGETSDVRLSGGHCYMELVEKDGTGANVSRIRAIIWANTYRALSNRFATVTGSALGSGMKIRACVTASYHPSYGMSVTISDIDPAYTAGDAVRRRNEILTRLQAEGLLNLNRELRWATVPNRIAVVSARGAAGYGDFMTHLFSNTGRLRFSVDLFEAVMQGDRTAPTVRAALESIRSKVSDYDAVVIIRGGGSTSDLAAFDDYALAAAVATFPLPVIVGIGHERDVTVLDYVANIRVKTPTAAAEALVERVARVFDALGRAADKIFRAVSSRIATNREALARASASLPGITGTTLLARRAALDRIALNMASALSNTVLKRNQSLSRLGSDIDTACRRAIERNKERLRLARQLLEALSPDAVLARGFSLTMLADGKVLRSVAEAHPDAEIVTRLSDGSLVSVVVNKSGDTPAVCSDEDKGAS